MTHSMTGFTAATGQQDDWRWSWELRSVNGRGLDLRLRIPDWIEGLEPALRSALQKAISRGSVSLSLRVTRDAGAEAATISADGLDRALTQIECVETAAMDRGLTLKPATAADILTLRGVLETGSERDGDVPGLRAALLAALPELTKAITAGIHGPMLLFKQHPNHSIDLPMPENGLFFNINSPDDLQTAHKFI